MTWDKVTLFKESSYVSRGKRLSAVLDFDWRLTTNGYLSHSNRKSKAAGQNVSQTILLCTVDY